jgi:hypothetical protein
MKDLRKRLEATAFPDLGAMMEGYAQAAVELAKAEFRRELDYSSESVDVLDDILIVVSESPEKDLDFEVRLWGSYLGELLRRRYAGGWEMTQYPGGTVAVPAVDVRGYGTAGKSRAGELNPGELSSAGLNHGAGKVKKPNGETAWSPIVFSIT